MKKIRISIFTKGIKMWQIAETIGISEATLYRWMRTPNEAHEKKILEAIQIIESKKG